MKKRSKIKQILVFLLALSIILGNVTVFAAERTGIIEIYFHGRKAQENQFEALANAEFTLYKVGVMQNGKWKLEGEFADSDISLDHIADTQKRETAEQLYYYARMNRIKGEKETTDETGSIRFDHVKDGLYLVVQEKDLAESEGVWRSVPFLVSMPLNEDYFVHAEPKSEWIPNEERIIIGLRDLTIYTGGNEKTGKTDGFPTPRYTGIPENVTYEVNGQPWDTSKGEYPFEVVYTYGEEEEDLSLSDTWEQVVDDTESGLDIAHVVPKQMGSIVTAIDETGKETKVEFGKGVLTVRDVLDKTSNEQLGVIVSEAEEIDSVEKVKLTEKQKEELDDGLAVVNVPEGSKISVNGDDSLGIINIGQTALLFDDILYYNITNEDTGNLVLEDRVAKAIQDAGKSMKNRKYQSKYLDLVQDQDGNLWVPSSKGSVVTWPYPEGTDETTDFDLYHFRGLHREYGIKGNAEEEEAVYTAPQEKVEIEKTEDGIRFFIPESGFSPFVLTWTDGVHKNTKPSKPGNKNPIGNIVESVKTGDHAAIGFIFLVVLVSGSVVVLLIRNRKKNKKFF